MKLPALDRSRPFVKDKNRETTIIGSPSGVLEKAREFTRLGMEHFMMRFLDLPGAAGVKLLSKRQLKIWGNHV